MENLDDQVEKEKIGISAHAKRELNQGSGWLKAVAVLGFVGAGLLLLGAIGMFIVLPVVGILYLVMASIYAFLSYLLLIKAQAASSSKFDLDKFAENFHKFWKTAVILSIILFVLLIIFSVIMGAGFIRL